MLLKYQAYDCTIELLDVFQLLHKIIYNLLQTKLDTL